jgi:hypothetical protein
MCVENWKKEVPAPPALDVKPIAERILNDLFEHNFTVEETAGIIEQLRSLNLDQITIELMDLDIKIDSLKERRDMLENIAKDLKGLM